MSGSWTHDTTVLEVEPLRGLRLRVRFRDGTEGQVESPYGKCDYPGGFSAVRIHQGGVAWGTGHELLDISGTWLYQQATGLSDMDLAPGQHATRVVDVQPRGKYRVWVRFRDGTEGIADLGDLAGKGVFKQWDDPDVWASVRVESDTLAWGSSDPAERLDISRGSLYIRVTGLTWDDLSSARFALSSAKRLRVSRTSGSGPNPGPLT